MISSISLMPDNNGQASLELLVKAQAGDDEALNRLLERYLPRLERWSSGRLPWALRSMSDTADLVQEAFVHALPHLKSLEIRSEHAFEFYLRRAVRNRIIDLYKKRRHVREELHEDIPANGTAPDEAAIGSEALERYEDALASLKKHERDAIVLRVELGLTYEEIANELGKASPDAARMTVTRAIVRLADKMGHKPATSGRRT